MRLTLKQRTIARIVFLCGIILAISLGIIMPTYQAINTVTTDISTSEAQVEAAAIKARKIRTTITTLPEAEAKLAQLSQITLPAGQELPLIEQLESIAAQEQVVLDLDVQIVPTNQNKQLSHIRKQGIEQYYDFTLVTQGTLAQNMAFLQRLEQLPFYILMDTISIKQRADQNTFRYSIAILMNP